MARSLMKDMATTPARAVKTDAMYVRKIDQAPSEYDKLKDWQKDAFALLYKKAASGQTVDEIAVVVKKSAEWVSKFYNSKLYRTVELEKNRKRYQGLVALALDTAEEIMRESGSDTARKDLAMRVLDKVGLLEDTDSDAKQAGGIFQLFKVENLQMLTLDKVREKKAMLKEMCETRTG